MNYKKIFIHFLSYVIVIVIFVLLFTEFRKNWASIQAHDLKIDPIFIFFAFAATVATYLLTTYGWYCALNTLSGGLEISFRDSVAIVNTSNLTKYLPGKVWSYALQTYWLARKGFPNTLIVFVYVINMLILVMTFLIIGLCCLALSPGESPIPGILPCLIGLIALDILFIRYYATLFKALSSVAGRILRKNIPYYEAPLKLLLRVHLIHGVSALSFGMSGYLTCLGTGFEIGLDSVYPIMSSMIISDMIGFLTVIVPGGLGVREGVMYLFLKGDAFVALSLILPVATRIVNIAADLFLGAIGFALLKTYKTKIKVEQGGERAI